MSGARRLMLNLLQNGKGGQMAMHKTATKLFIFALIAAFSATVILASCSNPLSTVSQLTLNVKTDGNGSVTPNGSTHISKEVATKVSATPIAGYAFKAWTTSDQGVSFANANNADTTVKLTSGNATITATFTPNTYSLTVQAGSGGSVSPANPVTVSPGSSQDIIAVPTPGYLFSGWSSNTAAASIGNAASADTSVILTADATVSASFTKATQTSASLTLTTSGNGIVTPQGSQRVTAGTPITISASPAANYTFKNWSSSGSGVTIGNPNSATTTVSLSGTAATVTANFTSSSTVLTVVSSGNGTVSPNGARSVTSGAPTSVTATPATGYQFSGWTESGEGASIANPRSATTTVTLASGSATIAANFALSSHTLTVLTSGHGSVSPSGSSTVTYGTPTSIAANPDSGYSFTGWSTSDSTVSIADASSPTTTATLANGNGTVTANFAINSYKLTATASGGGTVTPSSPAAVAYGTATKITATPSAGYYFAGWTSSDPGIQFGNPQAESTTATLTSGSATVTATFTSISYSLTVTSVGGGSVFPTAPTTVSYGSLTTIVATPNPGYTFSGWSASGSNVTIGDSTKATTTATLTSGNGTVTANFTINTFTLSLETAGDGWVSPTAPQTVDYRQPYSISASPSSGYQFAGWTTTDSGVTIANPASPNTTATLDSGDAKLTANFAPVTYTLNVQSGGNGAVTPSTPSTIAYGSTASISATPASGYVFVDWIATGSGVTIASPTSASTTVSLSSGNATLTAVFASNTYNLTLQSGTGGTVTPAGTQSVIKNAQTTISATPDAGYAFVTWQTSGSGAIISSPSSPTTTIMLTSSDATATAVFVKNTYNLTLQAGAGGTVTPAGTQSVTKGVATTVSATPQAGYTFAGWTSSSSGVSIASPSSATTTVTLTSADATVSAVFTDVTYNLTVDSGTGGAVTPSGTNHVLQNTATTIGAIPDTGYQFSGWSSTGSGVSIASPSSATTTVTLTSGDGSVYASFAPITYNLTIQSGTGGSATPGGTTSVQYGVQTIITASPSHGYQFSSWNISSGAGVSITNTANSTTYITLTRGDATIIAQFAPITYAMTLQAGTGGTVYPPSTTAVEDGAATAITATPAAGYSFTGWSTTSATTTITDCSATIRIPG